MTSRLAHALLLASALCLAACEPREVPMSTDPTTPAPTPTPVQASGKATPKPGSWIYDKYQNPLEQKPGDRKKIR